jgi:hypothetical protein
MAETKIGVHALGYELFVSEFVPEFGEATAVDGWEDRLAAMTLHHLDLSLLDLTAPERVMFFVDQKIVCHPRNADAMRRALYV